MVVTHNETTGNVTVYIYGEVDVTQTINYNAGAVGFDRIGGSYLNSMGTGDLFYGAMDNSSNLVLGSKTYTIQATDPCGNSSDISIKHSPIYFSKSN